MPEIVCADKDCVCKFEPEDGVRWGDAYYCSERCVDGRGCDHDGCNCGKFPTAEPPLHGPAHAH